MSSDNFLTEVTAFEEPLAKWFRNSNMDLTVRFYPDGAIRAFQIDYRERQKSYSLSWLDFKLRHFVIDDGETDPTRNMTPIVLSETTENRESLIRNFEHASGELPLPIRDFVLESLSKTPAASV